jgi:two-component sensor histidine kinase
MPRIDIPPSAASVAAVRHALAEALQPVGTVDSVADAALVLSELVSNAVRHAQPLPGNGLLIDWHLEDSGHTVVIAVTDGAFDAEPRPRAATPGHDSGRGLSIVSTLASDWGVRTTEHDKTVWARVTLRDPLAHLQ